MDVVLFDANRSSAFTTAVLSGISYRFRASIAGNLTVAVLADEPPLWRGESPARAKVKAMDHIQHQQLETVSVERER
jgi:hypothetical protein